jgi:hypothetical protein
MEGPDSNDPGGPGPPALIHHVGDIVMVRQALHLVMAIALVASMASIIQTALSRSEPCPLCGGPMQRIGTIHSLSIDRRTSRATGIHRCHGCDYEVILRPEGCSTAWDQTGTPR